MLNFDRKGRDGEDEYSLRDTSKIIRYVILGMAVIVILLVGNPLGTVGAGERGILLRFNAVTGTIYDEGLYFRWPLIERVIIVDIKIQKEQADATAASKDLQTVHSDVAVNFHIGPDRVASIYQEVGIDYKTRLIDPTLQEAVKAITAKFTAEELITRREAVRDDIKTLLKEKLEPRGIMVDEFNIVDFGFSPSFNSAIEAKVTAEQQALAAKNKLEQIKFEADQRIAEARGKSEAMRVESEALRTNPQILELRALEKWNGVLPQVTGSGGVPFINIQRETGR
ncbi:MAG: prohibitin family protein [Acidobacteria bacterium]|nr:prohibitin family protein [Acidobacteriota bacterium]